MARCLALGLVATACGGDAADGPAPATRGPVSGYESLVDSLRAGGLEVEHAGETAPPFLAVPARVARAEGDLVQVYVYADSAAVDADARGISGDGFTVGGQRVAWLGPPHFHRRGRLLVLHIGDRPGVAHALAAIFGPPFAGPSTRDSTGG
ncbi:MAG TPA: hypothetical protein VM778_11835 [Gemmatimonadota bacterium]|nr:hypothetical protein [Gemmatimonadota bacterium]